MVWRTWGSLTLVCACASSPTPAPAPVAIGGHGEPSAALAATDAPQETPPYTLCADLRAAPRRLREEVRRALERSAPTEARPLDELLERSDRFYAQSDSRQQWEVLVAVHGASGPPTADPPPHHHVRPTLSVAGTPESVAGLAQRSDVALLALGDCGESYLRYRSDAPVTLTLDGAAYRAERTSGRIERVPGSEDLRLELWYEFANEERAQTLVDTAREVVKRLDPGSFAGHFLGGFTLRREGKRLVGWTPLDAMAVGAFLYMLRGRAEDERRR